MAMANSPLYLGDLWVGRRFITEPYGMTENAIKAFAAQFDPQPFHLDDDAGQHTIFGGLAASGWHTAAITMKLMVKGIPIAGGIIGAGGELSWPRPTRPGDVLHVEAEVLSASPSRLDRGSATLRCVTKTHTGEVVQTLTVRLIVPVRSLRSVASAVAFETPTGKS